MDHRGNVKYYIRKKDSKELKLSKKIKRNVRL